jgi:hypothetical protein
VTSWDSAIPPRSTRSRRRSGRCERGSSSQRRLGPQRESRTELFTPWGPSLRWGDGGVPKPEGPLPFLLITLIWGSTWIVIKDQLGAVPPAWSVTYRFVIAGRGDVRLGFGKRRDLRASAARPSPRRPVRNPAILPQLQLRLCRRASRHLGLVAVVFALLMVPNSALAWLFLKHRVTGRSSLGSAIATAGVALLFVQESAPARCRRGAARHRPHPARRAFRLHRQHHAGEPPRVRPADRRCSPGGWSTESSPTPCSPGPRPARRRSRPGRLLARPALSRPVRLGARLPLYFAVIRAVGPGKAAYSSVLVPILAMALLDPVRRLSLVDLAVAGGVLALAGLVIALRSRAAAS